MKEKGEGGAGAGGGERKGDSGPSTLGEEEGGTGAAISQSEPLPTTLDGWRRRKEGGHDFLLLLLSLRWVNGRELSWHVVFGPNC